MEIAIPAIALGSLYILSNRNNHNTKEGYTSNKLSQLKPVPKESEPVTTHSNSTPEILEDNFKPYTDKYMQPEQYIEQGKGVSVSGDTKPLEYFSHNNMQPFFRSTTTQPKSLSSHYLDYKQGAGVHHQRKKEIAPLFSPQESKNTGWAYGMPNQSNFIQSRMNPSRYASNVKPWEEIRVGPGLGKKDNLVDGTSGYNAGLEARDKWMPKNVDELRVKNKPKVSYGGTFLGGKSHVTNRGSIGIVHKKSPQTFYVNSPDRYFTTVGQEKAQRLREKYILKEEKRVHPEYYGSNGNTEYQAPYTKGYYHPSTRPELDAPIKHITNAHARDKQHVTKNDYGIEGHRAHILPNQRSTTQKEVPLGAVSTFAKAVVAPLMDIIRPTRKDNVIGNVRISGNMGNQEITKGYVKNPKDVPRTTMKEMTDCNPYPMRVQSYVPLSYSDNTYQARQQHREDTHQEFTGVAKAYQQKQQNYDYAYNAHLIDKEPVLRGREPKGSSVKIFNGQDFLNMDVKKLDKDRINHRQFVPQTGGFYDTPHRVGEQRTPQHYDVMERNNPELLSPFRNNPYTKSLHSY